MKIHATGRQQGKTTRLIEWMMQAPDDVHRVLVTHNAREADRLYREYGEKLGLERWQFMSAMEVRGEYGATWRGRKGRLELGVDNLDIVLPMLLGWRVGWVSATADVVETEER